MYIYNSYTSVKCYIIISFNYQYGQPYRAIRNKHAQKYEIILHCLQLN